MVSEFSLLNVDVLSNNLRDLRFSIQHKTLFCSALF